MTCISFRLGDHVETTNNALVWPGFTVPAGTKGHVVDVDPDDPSELIVLLKDTIPELAAWQNMLPCQATDLVRRSPARARGSAKIKKLSARLAAMERGFYPADQRAYEAERVSARMTEEVERLSAGISELRFKIAKALAA